MTRAQALALGALTALTIGGCGRRPELAAVHGNRRAAGRLEAGVLKIALEARPALWHPESDSGAALPVVAFAEAGQAPTVPGPLIRVPAGTEIRATIRNALPDSTLVLHGFHSRPGKPEDTLQIGPGATREVRFAAGAPGTYFYWGTTTHTDIGEREWLDSQLSGAFIVDSTGAAPEDRVFVLGIWSHFADTLRAGEPDTGEVMVINGKAWPYTERIQATVGDTVAWRVINPTSSSHPMHLHGVYFRVSSRGNWAADTAYAPTQRPLLVTELLLSGRTTTMRWAPARPGNWPFHCHFAFHVSHGVSLEREAHHGPEHRMAGLVLAITARPRTTNDTMPYATESPRRIRLLIQAAPGRLKGGPALGYVIQEGGPAPTLDSVTLPSPTLLLERGKPVAITVVNHLSEPTAVHWHGMELPSWPDGVPGLSGIPPRLAPAIQPGDSFVAEFTPPRSGTFIYHSHANEVEQLSRGLYAPMLVVEPGERPDPVTDHVVLVGLGGVGTVPDSARALVNGSTTPAPLTLRAGRTHRLRLINIEADHRILFTLRRDSTVVTWRALAVDGADLPPALATERAARLLTGPGMTADFGFTPPGPGSWSLDVSAPFAEIPWTVTLPLLVR